jgi:tripartite-type tricarboxylate transporter receptor subunit TctC
MEIDIRHICKLAVLAVSIALPTLAQAAWPERPVVVLVPFAPGGINDVLARLTAERLQAAFGRSFVVENEPGAAGILAASRVARAQPDGYTLFFSTISQIAIAPFTHKIDFDPLKDFKPISIVATTPFVITVGKSFPASSLAEFAVYVRSRPGQLTFGSAGTGSLTHLASEVFLKSARLSMVHVPYKGVLPAFTDLLAGHVEMLAASPVELRPYFGTDTVKLLAVTGAKRSRYLPDVPAVAEQFPAPEVVTWNGLLAPARTPPDVIDALSRELGAVERNPEFRKRLTDLGVDPEIDSPDEFARIIAADHERWREIIRDLGLKVQ